MSVYALPRIPSSIDPNGYATHALYGAAAAAFVAVGTFLITRSTGFSVAAAIVLTTAAAWYKEHQDKTSGKGVADNKDLLWTVAGGVVALLVLWLAIF